MANLEKVLYAIEQFNIGVSIVESNSLIGNSNIKRWSTYRPNIDKVLDLAEILRVTPDYITGTKTYKESRISYIAFKLMKLKKDDLIFFEILVSQLITKKSTLKKHIQEDHSHLEYVPYLKTLDSDSKNSAFEEKIEKDKIRLHSFSEKLDDLLKVNKKTLDSLKEKRSLRNIDLTQYRTKFYKDNIIKEIAAYFHKGIDYFYFEEIRDEKLIAISKLLEELTIQQINVVNIIVEEYSVDY